SAKALVHLTGKPRERPVLRTGALAERPAPDEGAALVVAARLRAAPDHGRPAPPAGTALFLPGSSSRLRHAEEPGPKKSRGQPPGAGVATCGTRASPGVILGALPGRWSARRRLPPRLRIETRPRRPPCQQLAQLRRDGRAHPLRRALGERRRVARQD